VFGAHLHAALRPPGDPAVPGVPGVPGDPAPHLPGGVVPDMASLLY
jgi:hypothetical protein